jgi:hypothetical protein
MAANRAHEHPELRARVDATLIATKGFATLVSSSRTFAQQAALFKKYKEGRGNLAADPNRINKLTGRRGSNHQVQDDGHSYAVDISVRTVPNRKRLEAIANSKGLVRTVPSEYWHFELMASNGRAHRFGDHVEHFELGAGFDAFRGELDAGDAGPEVEHLQLLLIRAEVLAFGEDDGVFGNRTVAAVKLLQQRLGIPETGRWDEVTEDAATERFGTEAPKMEDHVRYWLMRVDGTAEVLIVSEDFTRAKHVTSPERLADIRQLAGEADTEILNDGEERLVSQDFLNFVLGQ